MQIVYFSNFMNHHQKPLSDELYKLTKCKYIFVEVTPMYHWLKEGGYSDFSDLPYVLKAWESKEKLQRSRELAISADVALFGGYEVIDYAILRSKKTNKISFEVGERWLKRGFLNFFSPRLLYFQWCYHTLFYKKPYFRLCSSAFAAEDEYKMHSFIDRCYKWGYFTKVDDFSLEASLNLDASSEEITPHIMWCARFLRLKHPEIPIYLAKTLKDKGYKFHLDMYGSGIYKEKSMKLAAYLKVEDVVTFCGNLPNEDLLAQMRKHEIFLFTSDQNEGWGAVANEAMSNGCVLVGSDAIGSIPFLVKDGENGLVFKSANKCTGFTRNSLKVDDIAMKSITEKVEWLLTHSSERIKMAYSAYKDMSNVWSPVIAAQRLLVLIENLQHGMTSPFDEGPCSKSLPLSYVENS